MLSTWTQNVRITQPFFYHDQFCLAPDPPLEGASIILDEVEIAKKVNPFTEGFHCLLSYRLCRSF